MTELKLREHTTSQATAYRFVFEDGNWAVFTLNDATMEMVITSSWGTYGYRWDAAGPSMARFIARVTPHYILEKFQYLSRPESLQDGVDLEATEAAVRKALGDNADEYENDIEEWSACEFALDLCPRRLAQAVTKYWNLVKMEKSGTYTALCDDLLPFFSQWLRDNVVPKLDAKEGAHAHG